MGSEEEAGCSQNARIGFLNCERTPVGDKTRSKRTSYITVIVDQAKEDGGLYQG